MGLFDGGAIFGNQGLGDIVSMNLAAIPGVGSYMGGVQANNANLAINSANNAFNANQAVLNRDFQANQASLLNSFNAGQAQINRDFQASQVDKQMAFQADQSAHAIQTRVRDLQAAGLNPALAYGQGGATAMSGAAANGSAASGAMASGSQASSSGNAVMQNPLRDAASSALAAVSVANDVAAVQANIARQHADTRNIDADTLNKITSNPLIVARIDNVLANTELTRADKDLRLKQILTESAKPANVSASTDLAVAQTGKAVADTAQSRSAAALNYSRDQAVQTNIPALKSEADYQSSWWGRLMKYVAPAVNSASTGTRAITPLLP